MKALRNLLKHWEAVVCPHPEMTKENQRVVYNYEELSCKVQLADKFSIFRIQHQNRPKRGVFGVHTDHACT